jgi:glutaredoxin 3
MAKIEIYTKAFCGYCSRAKALLGRKGVSFEEYDITMGGPKRQEMLQRAPGSLTVPQIFIDWTRLANSTRC